MKLVPLGDRVVLKQVAAEETTKSGIVLPGQTKEKPQQAEVVAVGFAELAAVAHEDFPAALLEHHAPDAGFLGGFIGDVF